jgi:hypothetical protein
MKWIKVTDKLPEKSGRYLVYEKKEPHCHNCAAYNYPVKCCEPNIAYFRCFQLRNWEHFTQCNNKCNPTYWMPLPDNPE